MSLKLAEGLMKLFTEGVHPKGAWDFHRILDRSILQQLSQEGVSTDSKHVRLHL